MALTNLSRIIINSLKAILGEGYTIRSYERLPSRRNEVYKIIGSITPKSAPEPLVAKFYTQAGIAHETSILQEAHQHNLHVPSIIGTTADVLLLEYIDAPNLCDLITLNPDPMLAQLMSTWFVQYHNAFSRTKGQVLVKGDARIRNFLVGHDHLVGVDFEESHIGNFLEDLAVLCASILDTTPLFTGAKLKLCTVVLNRYASLQKISNIHKFKADVQSEMIWVLRETSTRRGNPPTLLALINQFEKTGFSLF